MVAKLSMLNISRWLLLVLVTAAFFSPFASAEDKKKFKVSEAIKSAKAVVSLKEFEAEVIFEPTDYVQKRNFDLTVGGCKLSVEARKDSGSILFSFYNEGRSSVLGRCDNPKSFLAQEQNIAFKSSIRDHITNVNCEQGINFASIDEDPGKYTIEITLSGEIKGFELTSESLAYSPPKENNIVLWICIGVGIFVALLAVSAAAVIAAFCIKRRKQKAAAAVLPATKSKEQVKSAVSKEKSKVSTAKELSSEKQMPSKEQVSVNDDKPAKTDMTPHDQQQKLAGDLKKDSDNDAPKADKDQKLARPSAHDPQAKQGLKAQPTIEENAGAQEPRPTLKSQPTIEENAGTQEPRPILKTQPTIEDGTQEKQATLETQATIEDGAHESRPKQKVKVKAKSAMECSKVHLDPPKKRTRNLSVPERLAVAHVEQIKHQVVTDEEKQRRIAYRDFMLARGDELYAERMAEEKAKKEAEEKAKKEAEEAKAWKEEKKRTRAIEDLSR